MNLRRLSFLVVVLFLFSCAAKKGTGGLSDTRNMTDEDMRQEMQSSAEKFQKQMLRHARSIQRSWGVTAEMSDIVHGENRPIDFDRLRPSLRRVSNFPGGYEGRLDPFIRGIASIAGFEYLQPSGKKPIGGLSVVLGSEYMTIAEMIQDVGDQPGRCVLVVVDSPNYTIQLRYQGC